MNRRNKKIVVMTSVVLLGGALSVIGVGSIAKPLMQNIKAEDLIYTLVLDSSNAPTNETTFQSNVNHAISAPDNGGSYNLNFVYSSVKAKEGYHATLADGSSIRRAGEELTRGARNITATFDGEGKLFVKYGLESALHYEQLTSGTRTNFDASFTFNSFEIYAKGGEVNLKDLTVNYNCAPVEAENPDIEGTSVNIGAGAVVNGLNETYKYGEQEIIHVKAKGDGNVTSVRINGYELEPDTRFVDYEQSDGNYYSYYPGPTDVIDIETDVDEAYAVNAKLYYIDEADGSVKVINENYQIPAAEIDYSNEWYVKVNAPVIEGYSSEEGFYPNQDYIKFEKGTKPTLSFYYSKMAAVNDAVTTSLTGEGTADEPYLITSVADWLYFVDNAASTDTSFYKLTKSINLTGLDASRKHMYGSHPTKPVNGGGATAALNGAAEGAAYFSGTFDGSHCAIRGINITASNVTTVFAEGPFAVVNAGATVKDLTTYGSITSTGSHSRAGGIAGYNAGTITNCQSYVNTTKNDNNGGTGGIVGDLNGTGEAIVTGCTNYGSVSVIKGSSNTQMGGIVGFVTYDANNMGIVNCENYGEVSATGAIVGGIAGTAEYIKTHTFNVSGCRNFGNVSTKRAWLAGVIAYAGNSTISDSKNFGNVTSSNNAGGNGETAGCVARFVAAGTAKNLENYGRVVNNGVTTSGNQSMTSGVVSKFKAGGTINNCHNYGYVGWETESAGMYTGGILAWSEGKFTATITNSNNFGDVYAQVSGSIGGIAGYVSGYEEAVLNINNCMNIGSVTCPANNIGGIFGQGVSQPTINIQSCVNAGRITGNNNIGGVAGYISNQTSTIADCTNYGAVTGNTYVAGILGDTSSETSEITISNCVNESPFIVATNEDGKSGNICARPAL